jgi:hypothetical protein
MRILVTGSRQWKYRLVLSAALIYAAGDAPSEEVTVVHGGSGNADMMADREARSYRFHVEPHPADWHGPCRPSCKPGHRNVKNGRDYCPAAGNYRNQEMVDAGADICLAFYQPGAACIGTSDCVRRCTRAGITVRPYGRDLAMGFILTSGIQAARRFRSVVL